MRNPKNFQVFYGAICVFVNIVLYNLKTAPVFVAVIISLFAGLGITGYRGI